MSWKKNLEDERDQLQNENGETKHAGKGSEHEVVCTCNFKVDKIVRLLATSML